MVRARIPDLSDKTVRFVTEGLGQTTATLVTGGGAQGGQGARCKLPEETRLPPTLLRSEKRGCLVESRELPMINLRKDREDTPKLKS